MRFWVSGALTVALVASLGLAGCGDDDDDGATDATEAPATESTTESTTTTSESTTAPAEDATVALGDTELGQILVDAEGKTLYLFTNDAEGTSTCTGGCAETWPPLVADSPVAGEGIDESLLDTVARDDGGAQVTYNGHPLYTYAPDQAAGDTEGQGVGGVWYVVDASGNAVES